MTRGQPERRTRGTLAAQAFDFARAEARATGLALHDECTQRGADDLAERITRAMAEVCRLVDQAQSLHDRGATDKK